jgi:hypothetical protein
MRALDPFIAIDVLSPSEGQRGGSATESWFILSGLFTAYKLLEKEEPLFSH